LFQWMPVSFDSHIRIRFQTFVHRRICILGLSIAFLD
jgi:hypothetical protein